MTTTSNPTINSTISPPTRSGKKAGAWLVLLLAGAFEIGYALSVAGSKGFSVLGWSISAFIFFLLTLFCLSVALKSIDVGIGYAVWAGIGAVGAALLAPIFFEEILTPIRAFWLAVIIGGVIWLKLTDSAKLQRNPTEATVPEARSHE